jgi:hypothetical protein
MLDILALIPRKKRFTPSGWHVFNAICCHHRGHNADTKSRSGIKFSNGDSWSCHCFNCGFKCGIQLGKHFSANTKLFLEWCGIQPEEIEKLSFKSFSARAGIDSLLQHKSVQIPEFKTSELPEGSRPLNESDSVHLEYLARRGIPTDYGFYVVDGEQRQRIIIPYWWRRRLVGHTSRYYDGRHPKYVSEQQRGYVFNVDGQDPSWNTCILVEGQFDAISIGGCAFMGNTISDEQVEVLRSLNRRIIVVPDRDKTGLSVCDRALDLGYHISIPDWAGECKDVNDAVRKYGRLPALLSILQNASGSRIIMEMKRKKLL